MTRPLVVDARLLHYNRTGIGRYLRHLYQAIGELPLDALPAPVIPLYSRKDGRRELSPPLEAGAVAWTPAHHRLERWTLAVEVARLRPTLLHAPDHICPQPLGWKTVLTIHDLAFWRFPQSHDAHSRRYYDGLHRSVRQATRIICVSEATKRDLLDLTDAPADKVRVVYEAPDPLFARTHAMAGESDAPPWAKSNSVAGVRATAQKVCSGGVAGDPDGGVRATAEGMPAPDALPSAEADTVRALTGVRPYFIAVGTIQPRKNIGAIIRALVRVLEHYGSTSDMARPQLLVVGADGYDAATVKALPAALGIGDAVRFLGPLPTAQIAALYRGALALVYPSLLEGFGLPVLEAMASGAPVITSNCSSLPEVAGDAALLVDPDDDTALAGAMRRLAQDDAERQRLRAAGFERAAHFSWQRTAQETMRVFQEALAS